MTDHELRAMIRDSIARQSGAPSAPDPVAAFHAHASHLRLPLVRGGDAAPALKAIANVAVGYNNIDVPYARARGIVVTNTPDVLTESVADFTWAMILAITRRLSEGERLVRRGEWKGWALDLLLGMELRGKQLGLVGLGRIGRAVAARAGAFGMRVAYTSRTEVAGVGEPMQLYRLLLTSDVISLHVPLTPETKYLIGKRALTRMKRSAYLINTARGPGVA